MAASTRTIMAQTRAIVIDRLKALEKDGVTYPKIPSNGELEAYLKRRDEYEFWTNFLIQEAKHGRSYTESAYDEAFRHSGSSEPRTEEVRGD